MNGNLETIEKREKQINFTIFFRIENKKIKKIYNIVLKYLIR